MNQQRSTWEDVSPDQELIAIAAWNANGRRNKMEMVGKYCESEGIEVLLLISESKIFAEDERKVNGEAPKGTYCFTQQQRRRKTGPQNTALAL